MDHLTWEDYQPDEQITELRIHGAGATPIEEVLDSTSYARISGDETAGFYRTLPADLVSDEDDPRYSSHDPLPSDPLQLVESTNSGEDSLPKRGAVELYHWGAFSTGGGWKALWVLLLPFAFLNLAGWMIPRHARWQRLIMRLLGLSVSIAAVYWLTSISLGLLAACGPGSVCASRNWWLGFADWEIFENSPHVLALLPLLLIGAGVTWLLWRAGTGSADRYERFLPQSDSTTRPQEGGPNLFSDALELWHRTDYTRLSAGAHALGMLAGLAAGVALSVGNVTRPPDPTDVTAFSLTLLAYRPTDPGGVALLLASGLAILVSVLLVAYLEPLEKFRPEAEEQYRNAANWVYGLLTIGFGLSLATALWVMAEPPSPLGDAGPVLFTAWVLVIGGLIAAVARLKPLGSVGRTRQDLQRQYENATTWSLRFLLGGIALVIWAGFWVALAQTSDLQDIFFGFSSAGFLSQVRIFILLLLLLAVAQLWMIVRRFFPPLRREGEAKVKPRFFPILGVTTGIALLAVMVSGGVLFVADVLGNADPAAVDLEAQVGSAISEVIPEGSEDQFSGLEQRLVRFLREDLNLGEPVVPLQPTYYVLPLAFMLMVFAIAIGFGLLLLFGWWKIGGYSWIRRRRSMVDGDRLDPAVVTAIRDKRITTEPTAEQSLTLDEIGAWERNVAQDLKEPYRNGRVHRLAWVPFVTFVAVIIWIGDEGLVSPVVETLQRVQSLSIWITVGIFTLIGLAIRGYYSGGSIRGAFGGIWDILTFWPRHAHPFAPPAYTVRAAPELAERITELLAHDENQMPGRSIIVSAHSQGVPTSLAALGLVDSSLQDRIAILTYGSPTGMLYSRYFPDYFNDDQVQEIAGRFRGEDGNARWVGLWRLTDWTGGYVVGPSMSKYLDVYLPMFEQGRGNPPTYGTFGSSDVPSHVELSYGLCEVRLSDPEASSIEALKPSQRIPGPYGHNHTAYLHSPQYTEARARLAAELDRGLDLLERVRASGRFGVLTNALTGAGLETLLEGDGPFTVFAPPDSAFDQMSDNDRAALLANPRALGRHIVSGLLPASDVAQRDGDAIQTLGGGSIVIDLRGDNVVVIDTAEVIIPDIRASNGVIHVIDSVLTGQGE